MRGATSIQVDEANLPGSPDEWRWAARAINKVLDAVKGKAAVHLCFGNYGGQSIQKGAWDKLIEISERLHVDHIVMENAHRPAEELAVFRDLRPEIGMGLGVVDIKRTEVETRRRDRPHDRARGMVSGRRAACATSTPIAGSGCSSVSIADGEDPRHWWPDATFTKGGADPASPDHSMPSSR